MSHMYWCVIYSNCEYTLHHALLRMSVVTNIDIEEAISLPVCIYAYIKQPHFEGEFLPLSGQNI